ncbi:MAG: GTPase Era [Bacteroidales bacterium]|jgi:GTP-binding protein Era|nr:GTPase Era [Bacteroidales bacterium]
MSHKSGFVNILGNPNAGKSTLMNALVGEKLSIITAKAQTTRHRILGIVSGEDFQIVYSDTPGLLKPSYKLQERMMQFADAAIQDADIILYVCEVGETKILDEYAEKIKRSGIPVIVAINKIDLADPDLVAEKVDFWRQKFPDAEIVPVSALEKVNLDYLIKRATDLLPESPPYFSKDELTDKSMRFFVSEIIREKIFLFYQREIPYSVEIVVDSYKEEEKLIRISAVIYVERDTQKGIIIGHQGKGLKKVGTEARKDIEAFVGKKTFLETFVKVRKNWRENPKDLRTFGYE